MSYYDTTNPGGEYKAWMTPVEDYVGPTGSCPTGSNNFGFCDSLSKTDNFKVKKAGAAYVTVCKFNDLNDNGTQDPGEPPIAHWPITATGVDGDTGSGVTAFTDDLTGCVSFSISSPASSGTSVTLTEGTQGPNWTQTSPGDGTYDANGLPATSGPTTVNGASPSSGSGPWVGGVIYITVKANDNITAPNFGNFNPFCTTADWDYGITIAADYQDNTAGHTLGYDIISAVKVDPESLTPSDSSCSVTITAQVGGINPVQVGPGLTGGAFSSIYEIVTLHQNRGTTCYWAWWQELAVGSHLYSGSSLQSYLFQGNFQGGKETVPIPVVQCKQGLPNCAPSPAPQSISKDMSATSSGGGNTWSLTGTGPGNITANTCDSGQLKQSPLLFTITWNAVANSVDTGVNITAHVYATNPSPSLVYAQVSDMITGTDGFAPPAIVTGGTGTAGIPVPANSTNLLIATDTISDLDGTATTQYSDTATANYWDIFGNPGGNATASAGPIYPTPGSTQNTSATINNQESITGTDINFSVDSENPADPTLGTFAGGYTEGTEVPKSFGQPLSWNSISQDAATIEGSGPVSIAFSKSVYLPSATATTETLTDSSTLTTSDGVIVNMSPGPLTVMANAAPTVSLTITKNIDKAVGTDQTFTFHICKTTDYNNLGVCDNTDEVVTPPTVTVAMGTITSNSVPISLQPDNYTVTEDALAGWTTDAPQSVNDAPDANTGAVNCSPTATFNNKIVNQDLTVTKTAATSFTRQYNWSIQKNVDKTVIDTTAGGTATFNYEVDVNQVNPPTDSAWQVYGTISVTNPNQDNFTAVNVADSLDTGSNGSCVVTGGSGATIPAGQTVPFSYTCTYSTAPSPSSGTNTATASWSSSYGAPHTSASGTAPYAFGAPTNPINQTVHVTDTFGGSLGTVTATDPPASPASQAFKYQHQFTAPSGTCSTFNNTATITETSQTSSQSVKVCGGADLTVAKTAAVTVPTYTWNLTKSVSPNGTVEQSGSETLKYTVVASYTVTGSWTVYGTITVSNPNDWESITGVNVTDKIDNNGNCTVTAGTNLTLAKSGSATLNYTCTYTAAPTSGTTNTATATWPATFYTQDVSKSGTAGYSFSPLTSGPTTVTITHAFNDNPATTLGVINALTNTVTSLGSGVTLTSAPPKFTFTYSHVVNVPGGTCSPISNTAAISGTGLTSSVTVTVTVCNTKTGALTMGFWQGPQGQNVIGTSKTSGTCSAVITYLKGFVPFGDLAATSCYTLDSYVRNTVNAANSAGGGGLMLKGQMLATALTSYYSQPPNPLSGQGTIANFGGTLILLNPIKGTENVTSAFLSYNAKYEETVSQMLKDASANWATSQCSPSTGACKYNPYLSKTVMVYASDAFAYINQGQANIGQ